MPRKWTRRLLWSYLPVFFIVSSSLILITYVLLSEMSRQSAMKSNEALLKNVMQLVDNTLVSVENLMVSDVLFNDKVAAFYTSAEERRDAANASGARFLSDLQQKLPLLDSAYLYRSTDGTVMTNSRVLTLDQFGDRSWIEAHVGSLNAFKWTAARQYAETAAPGVTGTPVITLVRFGDTVTRGLLVVNISLAKLQAMVDSMYDHKINYLELRDAQGSPLFAGGQEAKRSAGGLETSNTIVSPYTGWMYRGGIQNGGWFEAMTSTFSIWLAVGAAFIAFGIVWFILITVRNAKPLQRITSQLEDYSRHKSSVLRMDRGADEFKFISSAIEELLEVSSQLQEQHEINLVYRKQHVLKELLEDSGSKSREEWLQALEPLDLQLRQEEFVAAIVEIDRFAEFTRRHIPRDQFLLKHVLRSVMQEMAAASPGIVVWAEWIGPSQLGVLFPLEPNRTESKPVREYGEKLRGWVEQNMPFRITISLGPVLAGIEFVSESYKGAWAAMQYKTSFGANRVIDDGQIGAKPYSELFKHLQHVRGIGEAFRLGDPAWKTQFTAMFHTLRVQKCSREDLTNLMQYLVHVLSKEMGELPDEQQLLWSRQTLPQVQAAIRDGELLDELEAGLSRLLGEAFDQLCRLRESRNYHHLIRQIKAYIEERHSDSNLSLTHLSDEFGIGRTYISKLFKEEFGEKFIDYITKVRMQHAQELLLTTDLTIQDISMAVGYPYALTFIRAFKKLTGTTPGSYRKSRQNGEQSS